MILKYQAIWLQFLLMPFWIDYCWGQIVFEENIRRSPGAGCDTPDGERGNCVRWSQCQSLRDKIRNWEHLKTYLCGYAGTEPKVCCPALRRPGISRPNSPTTRTTTTTTESPRPMAKTFEKPDFLPDECGSSIFTHNRVIGGQKAEKGSWPWMAVISKVERGGSLNPQCGATLVTARHVVTAAHCVVKERGITPLKLDKLMVTVGVHDLSDKNDPDVTDVSVDDLRIHEEYDPRVFSNDIAVVRLSRPVPFSNSTAPVCLPYDSLRYEDLTDKSSTITGFGMTAVNGSYSDVLMEVNFDIQDQEMCRRTYAKDLRITGRQLCAGTLDGSKDSCQGDSGGPLVTVGKKNRYYLVGIVSFGRKCSEVGYPGVYTRVTEYLDWLAPRLED